MIREKFFIARAKMDDVPKASKDRFKFTNGEYSFKAMNGSYALVGFGMVNMLDMQIPPGQQYEAHLVLKRVK